VRYREIAEDLRGRLEAGEFLAGRVLPSEAELAGAYGASRVTVRKALEELRDAGLVDARQGFGWFAAGDPLRQRLARLGTIEAQLAASGIRPERRIESFRRIEAHGRVREVLGAGRVLEVVRLTLADGAPFARVTVWCPVALARGLTREQLAEHTFHDLLEHPLGGAVQTIGADAASPTDAERFGVPAGSPVLRCERITADAEHRPILLAVHVFPAHRTEFVVDLPRLDPSIAPSGFRLVGHPSSGSSGSPARGVGGSPA
jgi:GntR family transcriptional regulator